MSAPQQETPPVTPEKQDRQKRNAVIGSHVIHALGQPGDFQRVQVRPLWGDHYRVNVLVGVDAASARIAHSYFLVANGAGTIVTSTPNITREYEPSDRVPSVGRRS
jgi:hypothetical protein